MDCKGSITVEACIVTPLLICFFALLFYINVSLFGKAMAVCAEGAENVTNYTDVHRVVGVIFETGGDLYDLFFS